MYIIADIEVQDKAMPYERLNAAVAAAHADQRTKTGMGVLVTLTNSTGSPWLSHPTFPSESPKKRSGVSELMN